MSRYCAVSVLSIIGKRRKKEEACLPATHKRREATTTTTTTMRRRRRRKRRRRRRRTTTTTTWKKTTTTTPMPAATPSNSSLRRVSFVLLFPSYLSLSLSFSSPDAVPRDHPSFSPIPDGPSSFLGHFRRAARLPFSPSLLLREAIPPLRPLLLRPPDGGPRRSEVERK